MKFIITDIPPRQRTNLEGSRAWMSEYREELAAQHDEIEKLSATVIEKMRRVLALQPKVATDLNAAGEVAALQLQLSELEPQLAELNQKLETEIRNVPRKIVAVREGDIRPAVSEPIHTQLEAQMRERIADCFDPAELRSAVRELAGRTVQGRRIDCYIQRRMAPRVENYQQADAALADTVAEIERILGGKPLPGFEPDEVTGGEDQ